MTENVAANQSIFTSDRSFLRDFDQAILKFQSPNLDRIGVADISVHRAFVADAPKLSLDHRLDSGFLGHPAVNQQATSAGIEQQPGSLSIHIHS